MVLEGVFKDSKSLLEVVESAKKNGYEVILRIVAVHERYSVWGINRRYEKEKIVRGHGRFVPIEYHNECYAKLLDSVDSVEQQKLADLIQVYDRDGHCLYSNSLDNGDWKDAAEARDCIEKERNKKLSETEQHQYKESWQRVFEYMESRRAAPEEISAVKALAERLYRFEPFHSEGDVSSSEPK